MAAASLLLAGCGGGGGGKAIAERTLHGSGYSFAAPTGWRVVNGSASTSAAGQEVLVSVTAFPLVKRYRPALWAKVVAELDRATKDVAHGLRGRVAASRTIDVADRRSRSYEVEFTRGGKAVVERLTFLLEGKREFQLLCRWPVKSADVGSPACERFLATFRLG